MALFVRRKGFTTMVFMGSIHEKAAAAAERAGVAVREAHRRELPDVLRVQRAGFTRTALGLGIPPTEMPPVCESLQQLEELRDGGMRTFVAIVHGSDGGELVVGTVRGLLRADGTVEIGRLAVADGFLRRGIAEALMLGLESAFPGALRFELFTGSRATEPLSLYAKLGYRIYERERFEHWELVRLERLTATPASDAPLH